MSSLAHLEAPLTAEQRARVAEALVEFEPFARSFARRVRVDVGDLLSVVQTELVVAVRRFDATRGVRFNGYARPGVVGAMIDFVAKERNERAWAAAGRALAAGLANDVEPEDSFSLNVPSETDPPASEVVTSSLRGRASAILARIVLDQPASGAEDDAVENVHRSRELRALEAIVDTLDPEERSLIELLYREDKTLAQAGAALGVHPKTVQRRHDDLRRKLGHRLRSAGLERRSTRVG